MDCKLKLFFFFLCFQLLATTARPQSPRERSVEVSVQISEAPPRFDFEWTEDPAATTYQVYRKDLEAMDWGEAIASLPGDATTFTDTDIEIGVGYEYAFFKKGFDLVQDTFCIPSGIDLSFHIEDMYAIGLCCNFGFGYYEVSACGEIKAYGDNFGAEENTTFSICDNGNTCEELIVTILPDMFPNSTSWTLENTNTGELIASSGEVGDFIAERPKYGFIYAGIKLPPQENRGGILLLIDDTYLPALADEIATLRMDLICDGWQVSQVSIAPSASVVEVRNLIQEKYNNTPSLKAVYLLGHIPVPYSGNIYPDTHSENHQGAWAADTYYGEMDGNWTDETVDISTAFFERNHNIPGDGKFDQDSIPSAMELQVGRVDLSNLSDFALSEIELTRRYLQKAHDFKRGQISVQRRALIDDNFGQAFAAPAASAWRNFAPMFGANLIDELDYFETLHTESYLWSYGCGSGTHLSASGIGTTEDFAADSLLSVFTMLFGSQFGDWDNPNNFLRAPLAQGLTLSNVWAGNPPWTFHHMAMGYHIGYSTLRTLNSHNAVYLNGPQLVHANLMGDPSLRMHPVKPIENLTIQDNGATVVLDWLPPANESEIVGYHIYKSENIAGTWERIHDAVIAETHFEDSNPTQGINRYMVRALKLETSSSGSYYNLSLGQIDSVDFVVGTTYLQTQRGMRVSPNPANDFLEIELPQEGRGAVHIRLYDIRGRIVRVLHIGEQQGSAFTFSLEDLLPGCYFLKVERQDDVWLDKVLLM